eukprot:COSAG04_NODE_86_length_27446_cov_79.885046_18_plen_227_part_00
MCVCKALLCDFVSGYLSAIVQHESFLRLEQPLLYRVLSTGLAVVPTDRLMEAVHKWVDARLQREDDDDESQQQHQGQKDKEDQEDQDGQEEEEEEEEQEEEEEEEEDEEEEDDDDDDDDESQQQQQECRKDDEEEVQEEDDEEEACKVGKTRRSREDRRSQLLASLLPPATLVRAFAQAFSDPFHRSAVMLTALGGLGCAVQPLGAGEHRLRRRRPARPTLPGLAQ